MIRIPTSEEFLRDLEEAVARLDFETREQKDAVAVARNKRISHQYMRPHGPYIRRTKTERRGS